jgi:FkbM family methyltransferase
MKNSTILLEGKKFIKTLLPGFVRLWKKNKEYHGLDNLDKRLRKYLDKKNGFFIEIGANDGISQSNTLWFEENKGWNGILVEAVPLLYKQCRINRPQCMVFNCACVAEEYKEKTIKIIYADLMSIVAGHKSKQEEEQFLCKAKQFCEKQFMLEVPVRTMTSILNECNVNDIDFMSLDVEGYELDVLKGLDLNKYHPRFLLIEASDKELFDRYLKGYYVFVEKLGVHDYLYKYVSVG